MKKIVLYFLSFSFLSFPFAFAEENDHPAISCEENQKIEDLRAKLKEKFEEASVLYESQAQENMYKQLHKEVTAIKQEIRKREEQWKKTATDGHLQKGESFGFWDQGETTLSQLLLEYGSLDYLYVIPYELGAMKIHLYSSIPLPHESWTEMIDLILAHNGIGIKQLNPFVRMLYIFKHDPTNISKIAQSMEDLRFLPDHAWVFYIFSPYVEQVKGVQNFFDRFSDPKKTTVQVVGSKIVLVSTKDNIEKLMQLYQAIWGKDKGKIVHVFQLKKILAQDAEKILTSYFQEPNAKSRPAFFNSGAEELSIVSMPSASSLVVMGSSDLVERAKTMIENLESQLDDPDEMAVFWYTCKHSDPHDLAVVLEQVYSSLSHAQLENSSSNKIKEEKPLSASLKMQKKQETSLVVAPKKVVPKKKEADLSDNHSQNFIVDAKTGSIMIVVQKNLLEKIQNLIKKLDVAKKMVQIEVLLVEKKMMDNKQTGINLLKFGSGAGKMDSGLSFNDYGKRESTKGLLDFIISRPVDGVIPAFDFAASFLMSQEDVKISATPSVLAINQTPATISIVEERWINNGSVRVDTPDGPTWEQTSTPTQYGITIEMTPTINDSQKKEEKGFVTLKTDITFDTTKPVKDQAKPVVTRRHVENEVRIADGETIILGGLRKQSSEDGREKIPFLGDIPGIGKLFGSTQMTDSSTEMFIFITPHIIQDPIKDMQAYRTESLKKRAGDIPEFIQRLQEAKNLEKQKLFEGSIELFLDRF